MATAQKDIDVIRDFNRFYTNIIGVIDQHYLKSPFSLSEGRVLYELSNSDSATARQIMDRINMDEGYLSRILDRFVKQGLVTKIRSPKDGRAYELSLTKKGRKQFDALNEATNQSIHSITEALSQEEVRKFISYIKGIRKILDKDEQTKP